jgi:hypothetical protein
MKRLLLPFLLLLVVMSGCRKWQPENRIQGNWKLTDAESRRFLNYDNITTGYENGVFTFYDNGTAEYREGSLVMNGNWRIRNRSNSYGNSDGTVNNDSYTELTMRLYNFAASRVIDWEFDNVNFGFSNKKMRAFITRGSPNCRYLFERQ